MLRGTAALLHLLAVTLPIVITVRFNSGAPHYIAYHPDAEPVEMCDWLSSCASPAWYDTTHNTTLRCTWRNGTEAGAGDDPMSLPGHNGTDVIPGCPLVARHSGPDALRLFGGLVYPVPAAASACCLVVSWFQTPPRYVRRIGQVSSCLASACCMLLMIFYAARPDIEGSGWEVAILSPCTWVAVRTSFSLSTMTGLDMFDEEEEEEEGMCQGITILFASLHILWVVLFYLSLAAPAVAAAHRILSTGEWGFAISSAVVCFICIVSIHAADNTAGRRCILLFGPGSFAVLTAVYFGTTPTHTPFTSYWLPLGNPDSLGFFSVVAPVFVSFVFMPDMGGMPPLRRESNPDIPGADADALEMLAPSSSSEAGSESCGEESDDDELEEEEGCEPADGGDAGDGMPLSLRLPTGAVAVVCVAERASLGDLRRRALREVLSASSGESRDDGTMWRVRLTSGGVRLRGPAHTPLHTLTLESGSVVEVCAEAVPHPASASDAQSDLLLAVSEGDAARTAELLRSQGRYPDMLVSSEGDFVNPEYSVLLPDAPSDVLHTLLRKARPAAASLVLVTIMSSSTRFTDSARHSGVLRRPAVMADVAERARPWGLYRLQQCTRRDLGFGVSLEDAVVACVRAFTPQFTMRFVCAVLRSWGIDVRLVSPAALSAVFAEEPPLWMPCLTPSSHPFSAVLLASGVPLSEVPQAVAALPVVCAYSAVCAVGVLGVACVHATFQMVDDHSVWMTVVFIVVSGPFFLFDLLPEWVQDELIRRTQSWWRRHKPGTEPVPEHQQSLMQV